MTKRFLFAYAPGGLTTSTKFYFVWLSDSERDRQLIAAMTAYAQVNTHFLFVPYSRVWFDFLDRFYHGSSLDLVWSWSCPRVQSLSATFFRQWAKGKAPIENVPFINLSYLPS